MQSYWMIVTSPDNFERTAQLGFSVQGVKKRHRKKAEAMSSGDRLVYYLTGIKSFAGTATITGDAFEDHSIIWQSKPGEDYPWRLPIRPVVLASADSFVPAETLLPDLSFVQKWPVEHWHLAFQGNVHRLEEGDFATIEGALRQKAKVST